MSEYFNFFNILYGVGILAICGFESWMYERALSRKNKTIRILNCELEATHQKLNLLRKLNPKPKDEDGYTFHYTQDRKKITKKHWQGSQQYICEIKGPEEVSDYYGHRIAKLLNDGYITAFPEVKSSMELVFKEEYKRFSPSLQREIAELELKGKEIIEFGNSISKVPTIKADTPMPPVKPPKK